MLDRKFVIDNAADVKANCANRNMKCEIDKMVELETKRRDLAREVQENNTLANNYSKKIGGAKDDAEREELKESARAVRELKTKAQAEHDKVEEQIKLIELTIPNMAHPDCPIGEDDKSNLELGRGKHEPREFDFKPLDHVELGQKHDWIDFEGCLLYTSPSPRDQRGSRMPSSA